MFITALLFKSHSCTILVQNLLTPYHIHHLKELWNIRLTSSLLDHWKSLKDLTHTIPLWFIFWVGSKEVRSRSYGSWQTGTQSKWPVKEVRHPKLERGFLPSVPTEGRALPKWPPEKGMNDSYQLRPQRWAWNTMAAAAATKNPVCKRRSLSTPPPRSLCTTPLPESQDRGTSSPREHTVRLRLLQRHAGLCCLWLAPHSNLTTVSLTLPSLSEQKPPNKPLL